MENRTCCAVALAVALAGFGVQVDAATIFLSDDAAHLYSLDTATWQATKQPGTTENVMYDIAFDAAGNLYGLSGGYNSKLFILDTIGNYNLIGHSIGYTGIDTGNSLAFGPNGQLFAANTKYSSNVFTINVADATSTAIGTAPRASAGDIEFDSAGNLYMAGYRLANSSNQLVQITLTDNPLAASGIVIDLSGTNYSGFGIRDVHGMAFAEGVMYGFSGQKAYAINLTTGTSAYVSDITGIDAGKVIYGATATPEPATIALLGVGLIGLVRRRPRKPVNGGPKPTGERQSNSD